MHTDAVTTERGEKGMYFFEEEKKKKGYQVHVARKWWLRKEEVAHCRLNSLWGLTESLDV